MSRISRGYQVAGSGTIAMQNSTSLGTGAIPSRLCIPTGGAHAYCTLSGTNQIAQFTRDTNNGALTPFATRDKGAGGAPAWVSAAPDGTTLYVSAAGNYVLYPFQRNTSTGVLTLGSGVALDVVLPAGQYPQGNIVSPDGLFVYVACRNPGGIATVMMLSRNTSTGAIALLSPSNVQTGSGVQSMGIVCTGLDNGLTVYVANFNGDGLNLYTRNTVTGQLVAHATQATLSTGVGTNPCWMAVSPDDKHLYVALDATSQVGAYLISAIDGSLTLIAKYSTGNGPFSCEVTPDGLNVYLGNSDGQTISMFDRNATTGALTNKSPSQVRSDPTFTTTTGSGGPRSITVSPDGKNLYACGGPLVQFRINP